MLRTHRERAKSICKEPNHWQKRKKIRQYLDVNVCCWRRRTRSPRFCLYTTILASFGSKGICAPLKPGSDYHQRPSRSKRTRRMGSGVGVTSIPHARARCLGAVTASGTDGPPAPCPRFSFSRTRQNRRHRSSLPAARPCRPRKARRGFRSPPFPVPACPLAPFFHLSGRAFLDADRLKVYYHRLPYQTLIFRVIWLKITEIIQV
jgi:hypothetical protein